jgi:phage portal protein BeeE
VKRIDRLRGTPRQEERFGLDSMFGWHPGMPMGVETTWGQNRVEPIANTFAGLAAGAQLSNGVVFAVMLARHLLFTEVRFQWQQLGARTGALFGTPDLAILETPWLNGTTAGLLGRMEQHASLAGNWFGYRDAKSNTIQVLRPTQVQIIVGSPTGSPHELLSQPLGYVYTPIGGKPITLLPEDVAHFAPIPDPTAEYRGMSWLTPIIREIEADQGATLHKSKFFEHAATPNMAVSLSEKVGVAQFREFVKEMRDSHEGAENAYKTLYLAGGADVTVVGADMKQLDFKVTQGAGETRICAAGGVPPVIVGLSEGLASATYSNYGMARRLFGDHWARPNWREAAAALQSVVPPPARARLRYDHRDLTYLHEDRKDDAEIAAQQATTIKTLVDAGFEPATVVAAVLADDYSLLKHSGLMSVQLLPPGTPGIPAAV